jgi:hypothetical protein
MPAPNSVFPMITFSWEDATGAGARTRNGAWRRRPRVPVTIIVGACHFVGHSLLEKRSLCYTVLLAMTNPIESASAGDHVRRPVALGIYNVYMLLFSARNGKRKNCLGGRDKCLKRFNSDKGIQGNPSLFSSIFFAWLGGILLDLA